MTKMIFGSLAFVSVVAMASSAMAATVVPTFTDEGIDNTGTSTYTRMYRADLTGLGLEAISEVVIKDSNSGVGGSTGIYSGFDLDAIFLDVDGSLATTTDRIVVDSFAFSAGTTRPGSYPPPSPSGGPTNGSSSATTVDEEWASLGDIDGIYFGSGSLTLGDGGSLTSSFNQKITIGSSLFLFAGEVSGSAGESLTGLVEVSDTPTSPLSPVPLPAGLPLMLTGLAGFGLLARRRKAD